MIKLNYIFIHNEVEMPVPEQSSEVFKMLVAMKPCMSARLPPGTSTLLLANIFFFLSCTARQEPRAEQVVSEKKSSS